MKHIFASILVLAACGSDPLEPGAGDSAGGGTNTLLIDGRAHAEPRFDNAKLAGDFATDFEIRISLNGQAVTTGTVTVKSRFGEAVLTWRDNGGVFGHWGGSLAGYDEVYQLDIVSGVDEVTGVIVDGPDIHAFTEPMAGATLDSTVQHPVAWTRDDRADITTFDAEEIDHITIDDAGTFMMSAGALKADADNPRENRIEVRRTNHVAPAGAFNGSNFAVRVSNRIHVLAAPNPAL